MVLDCTDGGVGLVIEYSDIWNVLVDFQDSFPFTIAHHNQFEFNAQSHSRRAASNPINNSTQLFHDSPNPNTHP